jgi:hypothetical protein
MVPATSCSDDAKRRWFMQSYLYPPKDTLTIHSNALSESGTTKSMSMLTRQAELLKVKS